MGADLIVSILPYPIYDDGEYVSDFDLIRSQVRMRAERTVDIFLDIRGWDTEEEQEEQAESFGGDIVDVYVAYIEQAFLWMVYGMSRDIVQFTIPCDKCGDIRRYALTGGMSWGDDPTDAFDYFYSTEATGIFDTPFVKVEYGQ